MSDETMIALTDSLPEVTKKQLDKQIVRLLKRQGDEIAALRSRLDQITGSQSSGAITDEDYLEAVRVKDRETVEKYWRQAGF